MSRVKQGMQVFINDQPVGFALGRQIGKSRLALNYHVRRQQAFYAVHEASTPADYSPDILIAAATRKAGQETRA